MQIKTPYDFTLDIVKPTKIPYMEFYQTDVNTSQMYISITNNDEDVDLTGHTLILNIKKSDGTEIQNLATVEDATKGLVNVSLTTQALTSIGECRVQLTVFNGETRKSTHEFKYYVKASLLNAEVPLSSNEYGLLLQLIDEVQTVENILNTSEATRITNEENRIILFNQLSTLKTELETLQGQLNSLQDNVEESEYAREYNEQQRQILKGQLDTLQVELEALQTELNDLNSTVNSNEETRKSNEIQRQANELDRIELKGQLDSLKGTLQSLENTLNTNDATRTNTVNNKMYEVDNKVVNYEAIITDIQNRFSLLSTATQQASEVINARTSTIRNKTFTDLNKRIEEAEKDILTQQSTQVTDNISYMNVLTNGLDGATDVAIKGNTLVNLYPDNIEKVLPIPLSLVDKVDSVYHLANTLEGNAEFNLKGQSLVNILGKYNFKRTTTVLYETLGLSTLSVESGKTYTLIYKTNANFDLKYSTDNTILKTCLSSEGQTVYKFVANRTSKLMMICLVSGFSYDTNIMMLEGDYTTQEIQYFEGIGSTENTTIKSVGENLFDKTKARMGYRIDSVTGADQVFDSIITDYIPIGVDSFFIQGRTFSAYALYDSNKNFLSYGTSQSITSTKKGYLRFTINPTDDINTVQISKGTSAKTYSAYRSSSITVTDTLRSVGSVSDEYIGNKKVTKIGRVVLNGSEGWTLEKTLTNNLIFTLFVTNIKIDTLGGIIPICDKFIGQLQSTMWNGDTEGCSYSSHASGKIRISISKTKATDVATFKAWLASNNVEVLYELQTPIESTITPLALPIYTNGTLIVEPTKLFPKLSSQDTYDKTINLKPSTLYSIFVNAKNTGTLEVDLGGIKVNITPTTSYTNNKVTITTPSTLTHSMLKLKGGNISTKDYMVIETDVVEPKYFSGISSVESDVVVKSIGENIFDGIYEIGGLQWANGLVNNSEVDRIRSKNFINVKPNTSYKISNNAPTHIFEYDINKNIIKWTLVTGFTTTSINTRYVKLLYMSTTDITKLTMLVEGSVAKPYQPYKEDKLTLSEYLLPEHFPLCSVGGVSDEYVGKELYKRVVRVIFNGSESNWMASTDRTNTRIFYISMPDKSYSFDKNICDKFIMQDVFGTDREGTQGSVSGNAIYISILKSKLTSNDVNGFKTWLSQNPITVIYELATPQEINLDRPLNIQVYKNGSIVTEPTKLLPKLSYTFPTNINSGLVGIQKSLQNVKDNQNFIMAYMLDLETRLSLIEGGM